MSSIFDEVFGDSLATLARQGQQQQGAFGQSLIGCASGLAGLQQQHSAFDQQMRDAFRYGSNAVRMGHIPAEKIRGDVYMGVRTFREELQHDVDQWLKNAL